MGTFLDCNVLLRACEGVIAIPIACTVVGMLWLEWPVRVGMTVQVGAVRFLMDSNILQLLGIPGQILVPPVT